MEGPAETMGYMIAGFGVIFGTLAVYIASLVIRFSNLHKDQQALQEVEQEAEARQPS